MTRLTGMLKGSAHLTESEHRREMTLAKEKFLIDQQIQQAREALHQQTAQARAVQAQASNAYMQQHLQHLQQAQNAASNATRYNVTGQQLTGPLQAGMGSGVGTVIGPTPAQTQIMQMPVGGFVQGTATAGPSWGGITAGQWVLQNPGIPLDTQLYQLAMSSSLLFQVVRGIIGEDIAPTTTFSIIDHDLIIHQKSGEIAPLSHSALRKILDADTSHTLERVVSYVDLELRHRVARGESLAERDMIDSMLDAYEAVA
jgi:hypothetical protein